MPRRFWIAATIAAIAWTAFLVLTIYCGGVCR